MEPRNKWWATLISLAMIAYGAASIYGVVSARISGYRVSSQQWFDLIVPGLIFLVGLASFVTDLMRQPEDAAPGRFSLMLSPYALAWRRLWSTKWLLAIYGTLAGIAAGNTVVQAAITRIYKSAMMGSNTYPDISRFQFDAKQLLASMPNWSRKALQMFIPRVGSIDSGVILAVALILALIWIMPRLRRLAQEPDYSRKAGFFGFCIAVAAVGSIFGTIVDITYVSRILSAMNNPQQAPIPAVPTTLALLGAADAIVYAIITAAMIGGILGSLARSKRSEAISTDTFLADAVSHFESLAGFYFVMAILPVLLSFADNSGPVVWPTYILVPLSFLYVFLMYAPCAIASQRLSFSESLKPNLEIWKSAAAQTLSLIATGAFFYVLYRATEFNIYGFIRPTTWFYVAISPIYAIAGVFLQALFLLAVWEFYLARRPEETRVPVRSL